MKNSKLLLPLGIVDFQEIIKKGLYFADKSLMIRDIIDDIAQVILLPRPRRFGKTLNLSMLYYYFTSHPDEKNLNLFEHLDISRAGEAYTHHQNQYPVIFLSLKSIKDSSFEQAYKSLQLIVVELYGKHRYLLESEYLAPDEKHAFHQLMTGDATEAYVKRALKILVTYLYRHHGVKPILLLDEYDTPIHTSYECGYHEQMVSFMQIFLGEALKDNIYLYKAVITGILRVAQASIFSGLNNLAVYSLLHRQFSRYFGFLEQEVEQIAQASGQVHSLAEIRSWYNGYQFGDQRLYNPWSIINGFHYDQPLQAYWVSVANNSLIKELVVSAKVDVKAQFESLLQGDNITQTISTELMFPDLKRKESALWNLLLFTGYLTIVSIDLASTTRNAVLRIPNREVLQLFETMVSEWFDTKQLSLNTYDEFVNSLVNQQIPQFERLLQAYIRESGSYFDFNQNTPEQVYHAFVLGLVVGLKDQFHIQSNRESGDGRFDVCLLPKQAQQTGMLIEFKKTDDVNQLEQTA